MRLLLVVAFVFNLACGDDETSPNPSMQDGAITNVDASHDSGLGHADSGRPDAAAEDEGGLDSSSSQDAPTDSTSQSERLGQIPTSCGAAEQGLTPVDCTAQGDDEAQCVFSNHCWCSEGYRCETPEDTMPNQECEPGVICVPVMQ